MLLFYRAFTLIEVLISLVLISSIAFVFLYAAQKANLKSENQYYQNVAILLLSDACAFPNEYYSLSREVISDFPEGQLKFGYHEMKIVWYNAGWQSVGLKCH
ncbi:MAG: prepilin-type N-terminal cleavage/methylation domain-containing protein [Gammaproteobacteria bacterium]